MSGLQNFGSFLFAGAVFVALGYYVYKRYRAGKPLEVGGASCSSHGGQLFESLSHNQAICVSGIGTGNGIETEHGIRIKYETGLDSGDGIGVDPGIANGNRKTGAEFGTENGTLFDTKYRTYTANETMFKTPVSDTENRTSFKTTSQLRKDTVMGSDNGNTIVNETNMVNGENNENNCENEKRINLAGVFGIKIIDQNNCVIGDGDGYIYKNNDDKRKIKQAYRSTMAPPRPPKIVHQLEDEVICVRKKKKSFKKLRKSLKGLFCCHKPQEN